MPSHNSKYVKSIKTNTVQSHDIVKLLKRKNNGPLEYKTSQSSSTPDQRLTNSKLNFNFLLTMPSGTDTSTTFFSSADLTTHVTSSIGPSITVSSATVPSTFFSSTTDFTSLTSTYPLPPTSSTPDLQDVNRKKYEPMLPQFYNSGTENGWYCKTCFSFSNHVTTDQSFTSKVCTFAGHLTRRP